MNNYFIGDWYADSAIMNEYLKGVYLTTGNDRQANKFFIKKGKAQSAKMGLTWRKLIGKEVREIDEKTGLYKTKLLAENPQLMDVFREYANLYFPMLQWSEITINYSPTGTIIKQHRDKVNVGDSALVAFGDYTGGLTYVENNHDHNFTLTDCRDELLIFNGNSLKHGVTAVTSGERYSVVFYKNKYKIKSEN